MNSLIEVRCPLKRNGAKQCNRLCIKVTAGSSGEAYCPKCDQRFNFQVDDYRTFNVNMSTAKPSKSD